MVGSQVLLVQLRVLQQQPCNAFTILNDQARLLTVYPLGLEIRSKTPPSSPSTSW